MKRVDEAISQFREYARVAAGDANSWDSLGEGLFEKGEYDAARDSFTKATSVSPSWPTPVYHVARCYDRQGKNEDALKHYRKYLTMNPSGADAKDATARVDQLSK
jgi:tetratricopeptide (TPR) repeat protein